MESKSASANYTVIETESKSPTDVCLKVFRKQKLTFLTNAQFSIINGPMRNWYKSTFVNRVYLEQAIHPHYLFIIYPIHTLLT